MEDILELILNIVFAPFEAKIEDKYNEFKSKIDNKALRYLLSFFSIVFLVIPGIAACSVFNRIFRGYWI